MSGTAPIVAETETPEAANIRNLIITNVDKLETVKHDYKEAREMLTNAYENNKEYRDAKEKNGETKNTLAAVKTRIENDSPGVMEKIDDLKEEKKELTDAISDWTAEYVRLTGKHEIKHPDGRVLRVKRKYKISIGQMSIFDKK